jgi:hypothetical protein
MLKRTIPYIIGGRGSNALKSEYMGYSKAFKNEVNGYIPSNFEELIT